MAKSGEASRPLAAEDMKNAGTLNADQPVPFTYPEGMLAAANSLKFLPDQAARLQALAGMIMRITPW